MRRLLAGIFAAWFSVFAWAVGFAQASVVTGGRVLPGTLQASTATDYRFSFTTPSGVAEGQSITLTFDAPFNTASITEDDVDVLDDGVSKTTASDCALTNEVYIEMISDVLTINVCAGDGGAIGAGSVVTIRIGTNAVDSGTGTHQITNPSTSAVHFVTLGGTFGDFGAFALAIGDDDSVTVSTEVTTGDGGGDDGGGGGPDTPPPPPPPGETNPPVVSSVVVTGITVSGGMVTFSTDEAATASVQYGLTASYGAEVGDATYRQTHSWPLTGLAEGTTYHFRIVARDVYNNTTTTGDFTFTTLDITAPILSAIEVTGITQTTATVAWTSNEASNSTVEYGTTIAYGSSTPVPAYVTSHSVPLSGLTAGTQYHYRVKSADASGNETVSADGTFTTSADLPPGNVSTLVLTPGNAQVALSWVNPVDADLQSIRVLRCTDAPPSSAADVTGCTVVSNALETSRTVSGLSNGFTYYFGVFAQDAAGQFASGTLGSAIPLGPDVPPGNVSNFRAQAGNERLTLSWTNPADADFAAVQILACTDALPSGPGDTEGCAQIYNGAGTSFVHAGLTNGQTYYFGAYARDDAGQLATGAFTTGVPSNVDEAPPAVSSLLGRAGDQRVTLTWTNPSINDLAAVRVLACTNSFPSAPTDLSGCTVISEGTSDTFVHTGVTNGQTYYYGVYVRDTAGQYSPGAFRSVTPSAQFAECGDNICNGDETPISCPSDCGPVQAVCGNAVCETGETVDSCPADCGLMPACGNGMCDTDETALTCPADCIALPPTTTDQLIGLDDLEVFVQEGKVQLNATDDGFDFLAGKEALVRLPEVKLPTPAERVQITIGPQTFNLVRVVSATGEAFYQAQLPIPTNAGRFATALGLTYQDGKAQTLSLVSRVQGYGLVYGQLDGEQLALSQAVVTLLKGASGNEAWDATPYGQENPRVTGSLGTYGWYVPNGTYRLRVEKAGYRTETIRLDVRNNLVGRDVRLRLDQPLIPTVIEAVEDLRANEDVQQVADVTTPTVIAVAAANTASLAVGFNLISYLRYITTAPVLLFSRRKRKGFGVVYNAITKVPVDLAIVRLYRVNEAQPEAQGQLVGSRVTDKGGRYFFLVQPGLYRLAAVKPGFSFPSKYLEKVKDDGLFMDVYHTEPIRVSGSAASIGANIPLDPVTGGETPARIRWLRRARLAQNTVAVLGNLGAVAVLILRPSVFTAAMAGGQLLVYALIRRLTSPKKPVNWGIVYDPATGRPLSNVIARIFEPKYNKLLETTVTDSRGHYTFLLGPNEYYAVFEKQGYQTETIRPIDYSKKTEPSELAAKVPLKQGSAPVSSPQPSGPPLAPASPPSVEVGEAKLNSSPQPSPPREEREVPAPSVPAEPVSISGPAPSPLAVLAQSKDVPVDPDA